MRRRAMVLTLTMAATAVLWAGAPRALAGGGCHGAPPGAGAGTTVKMDQNCFYPAVLYAEAGERVTWINSESVDHTVTGVGAAWGSYDSLQADDRASYGFEAEGVYVYSCIIHPGMVGAVVVGDGVGDETLDPATIVAASSVDTSGGSGTAAAPVDSNGNARISTALAVAIGIVIGLLGFVVLRHARDRRMVTSV